jgi:hypothetical protein
VPRDLKLPVRLFIGGGDAILAAIRRRRYDVWSRRPTVGRLAKLRLLAAALLSTMRPSTMRLSTMWWRG